MAIKAKYKYSISFPSDGGMIQKWNVMLQRTMACSANFQIGWKRVALQATQADINNINEKAVNSITMMCLRYSTATSEICVRIYRWYHQGECFIRHTLLKFNKSMREQNIKWKQIFVISLRCAIRIENFSIKMPAGFNAISLSNTVIWCSPLLIIVKSNLHSL